MYEIIYYKDKNGKSEVYEYMYELATKRKSNKDAKININKITNYIDLLKEYGLQMGEKYE